MGRGGDVGTDPAFQAVGFDKFPVKPRLGLIGPLKPIGNVLNDLPDRPIGVDPGGGKEFPLQSDNARGPVPLGQPPGVHAGSLGPQGVFRLKEKGNNGGVPAGFQGGAGDDEDHAVV